MRFPGMRIVVRWAWEHASPPAPNSCLPTPETHTLPKPISPNPCSSISPDAVFKKTKVTLTAGGETFYATGAAALRPGFTAIMPWKVRTKRSQHRNPLGAMCGGSVKTLHALCPLHHPLTVLLPLRGC